MQEKEWGWIAEPGSRTILRNPSYVPASDRKIEYPIRAIRFRCGHRAPNDVAARSLAVWHSRNQRDRSSSSLSYINRNTICLLALCVYRSSFRLSYARWRHASLSFSVFLASLCLGQMAARTLTDRTVSKFAFRFSKRNRTNDPSVMQRHVGQLNEQAAFKHCRSLYKLQRLAVSSSGLSTVRTLALYRALPLPLCLAISSLSFLYSPTFRRFHGFRVLRDKLSGCF